MVEIETVFAVMFVGALCAGAIGFGVFVAAHNVQLVKYDSFCQEKGYDKHVESLKEKKIDGQMFLECLDEKVVDKKLVETRDWLIYDGGS